MFCCCENYAVMPCTVTGSSCCNVTNSCLSTAPAAPNVGSSGSAGSCNNLSSTISGIANLGTSIAGAITGRPVVTGKGGVTTLGAKPVVTGQIQASSILFVVGAALIVGILVLANKGE